MVLSPTSSVMPSRNSLSCILAKLPKNRILPSLCRKSSKVIGVLLTLGRAATIAKMIETMVPSKNTVVGIPNHGFASSLGATDAMMIDMIIPLMLIIILALLSARLVRSICTR